MRTAFIGQRVRIVGATHLTMLIGKEATVVSVPYECSPTGGASAGDKWWGVRLNVDGVGERIKQDGVMYSIAPRLSHLEPILPEGAAPSEHTAEELFELLGINVTEGETV